MFSLGNMWSPKTHSHGPQGRGRLNVPPSVPCCWVASSLAGNHEPTYQEWASHGASERLNCRCCWARGRSRSPDIHMVVVGRCQRCRLVSHWGGTAGVFGSGGDRVGADGRLCHHQYVYQDKRPLSTAPRTTRSYQCHSLGNDQRQQAVDSDLAQAGHRDTVQSAMPLKFPEHTFYRSPAVVSLHPCRSLPSTDGLLVNSIGLDYRYGSILSFNEPPEFVTAVPRIGNDIVWLELTVRLTGLGEQWGRHFDVGHVPLCYVHRNGEFPGNITHNVRFVAPIKLLLTRGVGFDDPSSIRVTGRVESEEVV